MLQEAAALSRFILLTLIGILLIGSTQSEARVQLLEPASTMGDSKRLALVIGNAAYEAVPALRNTIADAEAVAETAQKLGYRVHLATDLSRMGMNEAINDFLTQIEPSTEVLFYYAGHGVELQGSNYLFPVDVPMLSPEQERLLRSEAINLSDLLHDFEARAARVTLVILDACRDNPFARLGTRSLGNTRGLGRVDPPAGTFVIYAAGAGEAALDSLGQTDTSNNGLFTRSLLKHMGREGLELREMVRELRQEVRQAALSGAGHSQTPSYYDQLLGDFYFRPKSMEQEEKSACEILVRENATKADILFSDYASIVTACELLVSQKPGVLELEKLLDIAKEQQAFQKAVTSSERALGDAYLRLFPNGRYRGDVEQYLASLGDVVIIPSPEPGPTPPAPEPVQDIAALSRALQTQLQRTGCYGGSIDGIWGNMSRRAVSEFARFASLEAPGSEPSEELLNLIRPFDNRVCPLACDARHEVKNDQCVLKTCAAGQVLSRDGTCVARQAQRQEPVVRRQQPHRNSGGSCFTFNGRRYCE